MALVNNAAKLADRDAQQAKLELAKFKEPRKLSQEQQHKIVASVSPFTGQNFAVAVFPEPEPIALAIIVDKVLKSAGWNRVPSQIHREGGVLINVAGVSAASIFDAGVEAYIAPDDVESTKAQEAFCSAMSASGIPCERHRTPQLAGKTPRAITVSIGKKP